MSKKITSFDRFKANVCKRCKLCGRARNKQKGLSYFFVKNIESKTCPFCRAYKKVYGKPSYLPID